jgi:hypothetical protein
VVERHLPEQAKRRPKRLANRRCRVVVQDLLNEVTIVEGGRRDRGVGVRSKVTLVEARHECGEELALADRPLGRAPHDRLCVRGMRPPEQMLSISRKPETARMSL